MKKPAIILGAGWMPYFDQMVGFFAKVSDYALYFFVNGLFGLGRLQGEANNSTFLRAYLRGDPLGEDTIGIRAKTRHRVISTLDRVYDRAQDARGSLARSRIDQFWSRCETAMLNMVGPRQSLPRPATGSTSSAAP